MSEYETPRETNRLPLTVYHDRTGDMKTFPVEIILDPPSSKNFNIVRETLTRIGVADHNNTVLWQSCHILQKRGHYYVVHFKEMFALDARETNITEEDIQRRDIVAAMLQDWFDFVTIVSLTDEERCFDLYDAQAVPVVVLSKEGSKNWELKHKYSIGDEANKKHRRPKVDFNAEEYTLAA